MNYNKFCDAYYWINCNIYKTGKLTVSNRDLLILQSYSLPATPVTPRRHSTSGNRRSSPRWDNLLYLLLSNPWSHPRISFWALHHLFWWHMSPKQKKMGRYKIEGIGSSMCFCCQIHPLLWSSCVHFSSPSDVPISTITPPTSHCWYTRSSRLYRVQQ